MINEENVTTLGEQKQTNPVPQISGGIKVLGHDDPDIEYDIEQLTNFLGLVFGDDLSSDENILGWDTRSKNPGYPKKHTSLMNRLSRISQPRAIYYGTATAKPHTDGKLYNRQELFNKLYVIVLDDIGTKGSADDLPEGLEPTYIIESSEGNYQYGYVLDEPVTDVNEAKALVQLIYKTGFADGGGNMPNKLVRLPGGVNGKRDPENPDKRLFPVKLIKDDGPLWTPNALLKKFDLGVTWAEVQEDPAIVIKNAASKTVGTSLWSPVSIQAASLDGIVDPILEWLYEQNMVVHESDEWVTIKCPWHGNHTSGDDTAGYSPVGRGSDKQCRYFHCFHDHCSDKDTNQFLQFISANDGPEASCFDPAAELLATYAYDCSENRVWKIRGVESPFDIGIEAFRNLYPHKVNVIKGDGKTKSVSITSMWLSAPHRTTVWGRRFMPQTNARIIEDENHLYINQFSHPEWGYGEWEDKHVRKFLDYLNYLLPNAGEREYFVEWLSAKVQNMGFRGAAILMIASAQGTGRTTLARMLSQLFGMHNVETVDFKEFAADNKFNEFLESPIVVCNETQDNGSGGAGRYRDYERLKEIIDFIPMRKRINPKMGEKRWSMVHMSTIMMSNHSSSAVAIAKEDRRFFVITNTHKPAKPKYFSGINEWLNDNDDSGKPKWARSVWRWLKAQDVDLEKMHAPAPVTEGKARLMDGATSPMNAAISGIVDVWAGKYISTPVIVEMLLPYIDRLNVDSTQQLKKIAQAIMREKTVSCGDAVIKLNNATYRVRVKAYEASSNGSEFDPKTGKVNKTTINEMKTCLIENMTESARNKITESIEHSLALAEV